MEISIYYFHSNNHSYTFTFIKKDEMYLVWVYEDFDLGKTEYIYSFILTNEVFNSYECLRMYYYMSLVLTSNVEIRDEFIKIYFKKDWKGLYFTKCDEILKFENEDFQKYCSFFPELTDEYNKKYFLMKFNRPQKIIKNYNRLINKEINDISVELLFIESYYKKAKVYKIFLSKILPNNFNQCIFNTLLYDYILDIIKK